MYTSLKNKATALSVNKDYQHQPLVHFHDNRSETKKQLRVNQMANLPPIQRQENKTGMPDNLKSGIENLSGMDMSDVKVHYNSTQPAQLQAHAFAQGNQIHIASGQERHLPHEAWHVVQQKQGRVQPTKQMKGKVNINDDAGLEKEADVMGAKAIQTKTNNDSLKEKKQVSSSVVQPVWVKDDNGIVWNEKIGHTDDILKKYQKRGQYPNYVQTYDWHKKSRSGRSPAGFVWIKEAPQAGIQMPLAPMALPNPFTELTKNSVLKSILASNSQIKSSFLKLENLFNELSNHSHNMEVFKNRWRITQVGMRMFGQEPSAPSISDEILGGGTLTTLRTGMTSLLDVIQQHVENKRVDKIDARSIITALENLSTSVTYISDSKLKSAINKQETESRWGMITNIVAGSVSVIIGIVTSVLTAAHSQKSVTTHFGKISKLLSLSELLGEYTQPLIVSILQSINSTSNGTITNGDVGYALQNTTINTNTFELQTSKSETSNEATFALETIIGAFFISTTATFFIQKIIMSYLNNESPVSAQKALTERMTNFASDMSTRLTRERQLINGLDTKEDPEKDEYSDYNDDHEFGPDPEDIR